jgi:choline dehydrogenase-like flavoprotein
MFSATAGVVFGAFRVEGDYNKLDNNNGRLSVAKLPPPNFDLWNALGADSWSYRECLPHFKRSEAYYAGSSEFHGGDGPLPVRQNPKPTAVATAFCEAAVELGFDGPNWDHNGARQEDGAGLYTHTIFPDGTRASTSQTYLALARRTGRLRLITNAQATAILFDKGARPQSGIFGMGASRTFGRPAR